MGALAVKIACFLLRYSRLSLNHRTVLISRILEGLEAIPLQELITFDDAGTLYINGEKVDYEQAKKLSDSAQVMLDSYSRKIIKEHVLSVAGKRGVVEGTTPEQLYFYRVAIWCLLKEEEWLYILASRK